MTDYLFLYTVFYLQTFVMHSRSCAEYVTHNSRHFITCLLTYKAEDEPSTLRTWSLRSRLRPSTLLASLEPEATTTPTVQHIISC